MSPDSVLTSDGLSLHLEWTGNRDPSQCRGTIVLVHGLGEHIGRYRHVSQFLAQAGWLIAGYDQRGHGKSPGLRGVVDHTDDLLFDLASVIDVVRGACPDVPLRLMGHSMGGLLVARFAASRSSPIEGKAWSRPIEGCILSSPALAIRLSWIQKLLLRSLGSFLPRASLSNGLDPAWLCTDNSIVQEYIRDPLVHDRISGRLAQFMIQSSWDLRDRSANWTVPTLLLYSEIDRCVCPEGSRKLAMQIPSELIESHGYPDMAHEILNEQDRSTVLADIANWLDRGAG
jgi:alpha-beta hydrolase superfamily lysophospholipase